MVKRRVTLQEEQARQPCILSMNLLHGNAHEKIDFSLGFI